MPLQQHPFVIFVHFVAIHSNDLNSYLRSTSVFATWISIDAYRCVYVNIEGGQAAREDVEQVMRTILGELASWARSTLGDEFLDEIWPDILAKYGPHGALREALTRWTEANSKPLVLLIDEIDALIGDSLLSVLRQLRAGYVRRPAGFPQSVVLCGVRLPVSVRKK